MFIAIYDSHEERDFVFTGNSIEELVKSAETSVNSYEDFCFERLMFYSAEPVKVKRNCTYSIIK